MRRGGWPNRATGSPAAPSKISPEPVLCRSLDGVEGDGVAELVEGADGSVSGAVGVASQVVIAAEVVVLGGGGLYVPYGGDDRVLDRDEGLEPADAAGA